MLRTHVFRSLGLGGLALLATAVAWTSTTQAEKPEEPAQPAGTKIVSTETLGGEERFLMHLSSDKPVYKPGETAYLRGVLLNAFTNKPTADDMRIPVAMEIRGPKGETVYQSSSTLEASTFGTQWKVPDGQAGGEYTIKVTTPFGGGYAPAELVFDVRNYRAPRLKSQIEFLRDGYGPGDAVVATVHVERAEGGIPAGAPVEAIARIDGVEVFRGPTEVNADGDATIRFELPAEIARGDGTLAMVVQDGGVVETASKTIPILLQTVDLSMYPEGGDLVAGLPTRVYLEAKTPFGKPADLAGRILDADGNTVAEYRTEHEGRGRFVIKPEAGKSYTLVIDEPTGIKTTYDLPEIKAEGVTLGAAQDQVASGQPVVVSVGSTKAQEVLVTVTKREREVGRAKIKLAAGETKQMPIAIERDGGMGVLTVTAWSMDASPLAERLVYRESSEKLDIDITANRERYTPGSEVELTVKTTINGKPASAVVGLTVTDDSVLEMIEKREQAPRLPVLVFFQDEVQELADAHVYLDPENEEAPRAVDLLLGTQGWRRFALVNYEQFLAQHGDDARRILALRLVTRMEMRRGARAFGGGEGGIQLEAAAMPMAAQALADGAVPVPAAAPADDLAEGPPEELKAAMPVNRPVPPPVEKPGQQQAAQAEADEAIAEPGFAAGLILAEEQGQGKPGPAEPMRDREVADRLERLVDEAENAREDAVFDRRALRKQMVAGEYLNIREFAHKVRPNRQPGDRVDFTETLFWTAATKTNESGEATVKFGLSDAVTGFRVFADGFSASGALGATSELIESVEPFYVEPKMPLELTQGDELALPIALVNGTTDPLAAGELIISGLGGERRMPITAVAPDGRRRLVATMPIGDTFGSQAVTIAASAGPYSDRVTRNFTVQPLGFPIRLGSGGMMQPDAKQTWKFNIPEQLVAGSVKSEVQVFPTPMSNLTAALEGLIREPYGCFEQTSSTVYPLVMAQQYFQSHVGIDPKLISKSDEILAKGYEKLLGFESKSGGFEWFGSDPGHLTLTAYGIMEFTDMAEVREVDSKMLARTRDWLLKQRDGEGGFKIPAHALHTWVAEPDVVNSYVTWCLLESGATGLEKEVAWVEQASVRNENSYVLALAANVLWLAGQREAAIAAMDDLALRQKPDGTVDGAEQTVVNSRGEALNIETTALATLAWLRDPDYADHSQKSIDWLTEQAKGGRYGSTQSTILALRAIVTYDKAMARPKAPGQLQLTLDGKPIGEPVSFDEATQGALKLPDIASQLTPGEHTIELAMADGSSMPFAMNVEFFARKPDSSDAATMALDVKLSETKLTEGGITEALVEVTNTDKEIATNPMAIIGVPGGLEVRHDQLKELVSAGRIATYEVIGRDVILYWREIKAGETIKLPVSLVAAVPGHFTGPASRAYLYYADEDKTWVDGLEVTIEAKQE